MAVQLKPEQEQQLNALAAQDLGEIVTYIADDDPEAARRVAKAI